MIEVIGVGASGLCSLGPTERRLVDEAEVVVGGERQRRGGIATLGTLVIAPLKPIKG